jgi:dipeptidyl aminopeptidase/acylaminoacyl peptidase
MDGATHADQPLYDLPDVGPLSPTPWSHFAISPDGTRLAFARDPANSGDSGLIHVHWLTRVSADPQGMPSLNWVNGLIWSADGSALYYGQSFGRGESEPRTGAVDGFELHRLTLVHGIDAGADRLLARLESVHLAGRLPRLVGVDEAGQRAAVVLGATAAGSPETVILLDTTDGHETTRIEVVGSEGLWASSPDGSRLAYIASVPIGGESPGTYRGNLMLMQLATGKSAALAYLFDGPPRNLRWSPDGRYLAWTIDDWAVDADESKGTGFQAVPLWDDPLNPDRRVSVYPGEGWAIAFAPKGALLLTDKGRVVDLADPLGAASSADRFADIPTITLHRVLGWVSTPQTTTPRTPTAEASASVESVAAILLTPVAVITGAAHGSVPLGDPAIEVIGWSPDGRWLAFWTADRYFDYPPDLWRSPLQLNFLDSSTGRTCQQPKALKSIHTDEVYWQADSQAIVRIGGSAAIGRPCETLTAAPSSTYALPSAPPGETPEWAEPPPSEGYDSPGPEDTVASLDGVYLATTVVAGDKAPEHSFTTRISLATGGRVLAEATWQGNGGFGDMGTGGAWLPTNQFLIFYSIDRGPLLMGSDGTVIAIAPTIFGIQEPDRAAALKATALIAADGRSWHLALDDDDQSAMLYHPESGRVETLPTKRLWKAAMRPDGSWLIAAGRYGSDGSDDALWVRGLEEEHAAFRLIPGSGHEPHYSTAASPDWSHLAVGDPKAGVIDVIRFPDGVRAGRWQLGGFRPESRWWSPDGRFLAVAGSKGSQRALFLIRLPEGEAGP